jgi:serine/threonine protein kinase
MADPDQKYKILEKLDSGGMAEIYRGEADSLGFKKQVAIKRILPHLTKNKKFVAMFLDEAKLSLFLNHANIVHVFDIGRSGQTFFIVMEYIDGLNMRTLTESLGRQGRQMKLSRAIFIMMEVCKGLGYAHDMSNPESGEDLGIVHRDVSPPNILLSKMGEVKLVDFGLAKAASQVEQTDPGVVKGKFSYLSPEAASGQPVDYRTDIFACGILLFEMLTSRRLFYGETDYQTVELVRQAKVPSLPALNPDIPLELDNIVHQALARDPAQRFQHAYELQDALAQFLFSRSLKVTNRDVAQLVRECVSERRHTIPPGYQTGSVINTLINEEIVKFTSLDIESEELEGAQPLSPDEIGGSDGPLNPTDFIDPRAWSDEILSSGGRSPAPGQSSDQIPEVASLEEMLEGDADADAVPMPAAPAPRKKASMWRGLVIALFVFVVLGAATVFVLHTLGLIGPSEGDSNQDIEIPQ